MMTLAVAMVLSYSGPNGLMTPALARQALLAELDAMRMECRLKVEQSKARHQKILAAMKESDARGEEIRKLIEARKAAEKRRIDD